MSNFQYKPQVPRESTVKFIKEKLMAMGARFRDSKEIPVQPIAAGTVRPSGTAVEMGQMFFDSSLGQPIWYTVSGVWVTASGSVA